MFRSPDTCIVLPASSSQQRPKAETLANKLGLPLEEKPQDRYRYFLVYTDIRLELQHNPQLTTTKENPIFVDFCRGSVAAKRISSTSIRSPLAKAAGLKPGVRPTIADATAGLGTDGVTLAILGCKVIMMERDPVVFALLQDGLNRAIQEEKFGHLLRDNIQLRWDNSIALLPQLSPPPHTILVDPMYPFIKKGPRNKKEMRNLRSIVGDDYDNEELFSTALQVADKRVVVKRPKGGQVISSFPEPSHHVFMKSGRFDVYIFPSRFSL